MAARKRRRKLAFGKALTAPPCPRRVRVGVVVGDPGLGGGGDQWIAVAAGDREGGEGRLALVVPIEQEEQRWRRCFLATGEAADEIEQQIVPGRRKAAGGDGRWPSPAGTRTRSLRTRMVGWRRAMASAIAPVRGGVLAIEQAGFAEQHRARADRGDDGAISIAGAEIQS